jgi:biotin carboxyl carrier protein
VTGTIKAILVEDEDLVMAGQALIKIQPTQMPKSPEE